MSVAEGSGSTKSKDQGTQEKGASTDLARTQRLALRIWTWVGITLLVIAGGWVIGRIADTLIPFVLAAFIILFLEPTIAWLQRHRVPRVPAVMLVYAGGVAIVVLGLAILLPALVGQFAGLIRTLPRAWQDIVAWATRAEGTLANMPAGRQVVQALQNLPALLQQLSTFVGGFVSQATGLVTGTLGLIFSVFMAFVVAFLVLADLPELKRQVTDLLPKDHQPGFLLLSERVVEVLSGYIRGQIALSTIVAVMNLVVFAVLGLFGLNMPYALLIAIIAGVLNVIPYIGPYTTAFIAALVGLTVSPVMALVGFAVIMIVEQVEATFIGPFLVGKAVRLHPVLILFALAVGGGLFGVLGIVLSIPIAAAAKTVFMYFYEKYVLDGGPDAAGAPSSEEPT